MALCSEGILEVDVDCEGASLSEMEVFGHYHSHLVMNNATTRPVLLMTPCGQEAVQGGADLRPNGRRLAEYSVGNAAKVCERKRECPRALCPWVSGRNAMRSQRREA